MSSERVSLQKQNVQEVFERAQQAQAQINTLVETSELEHQDFDDIIFHLEMIQRRSDPAQWKDYE